MGDSLNRKMVAGASAVLAVAALGLFSGASRDAGANAAPTYLTLISDGQIGKGPLTKRIEPLFDEESVGVTQALIVMRGGKIIAERYGAGIGRATKLLSRSLGKTVTAALIGIMVSDGRLALDSPVPVPAWSQPGDPRGAITLRNLLQMTSGLEHDEAGRPLYASDTIRMLFTDGAQDMAAFAEAKPIADPPGSTFTYSTADTMILCDLMTRMLTDSERPDARRDAMLEFVRGRLIKPAGLSSLTPEFDAHGTMIGGAIMHMTARDYAKLGELLRNRGRVNGHQLISARWVDFMTRPSSQNAAFGGYLWLNHEGEGSPLFDGEGSKRIFAASGVHGQYILVSPSQRLVIVRMGVSNAREREGLKSAMRSLVELFPNA